ncbi:hypothetical protein L7F22_041114 [Adiantum nelumboides]|nr:hypothetical protein [Adiantum nelumboides]
MAQDREQDRMECKQPAESPLLCANNCGFFGSPTSMNLCSQCYKSMVLKEQSRLPVKALGEQKYAAFSEKALAKEAISALASTIDAKEGDLVSSSSAISLISDTDSVTTMCSTSSVSTIDLSELVEITIKEEEVPSPLAQPAHAAVPQNQTPSTGSTRCLSCRRRVGLLGFKCRCGGVFCSSHRYSEKHGCTFDYKAAGRDAIAKANPVVKAEKLEKI